MSHRLLLFLALLGIPAFGQYSSIQGDCQLGGQTVTVAGVVSSPSTTVQRTYPNCTVTVYLSGTITKATLYSNIGGTSTLSNPFTADQFSHWQFYIPTSVNFVDVQLSGGGIASPFTRPYIPVPGSGSGGGSTVGIGTTTTGSPGTSAAVTNSGTSTNGIFNFTIPAGVAGTTGAVGAQGSPGIQGPTGPPGAGVGISVLSYIPSNIIAQLGSFNATNSAAVQPGASGVPDVTTYLQAAMNAAAAQGVCTLFPGPYAYHISDNLVLPQQFGICLTGDSPGMIYPTNGAIVQDNPAKDIFYAPYYDYNSDYSFENLFLVGGLNQIDAQGSHNINITHVTFNSYFNSGFTDVHSERDAIISPVCQHWFNNGLACLAFGVYPYSYNASAWNPGADSDGQGHVLSFIDRVTILHLQDLEGGIGTPYVDARIIYSYGQQPGSNTTVDSTAADFNISDVTVFGQRHGMCSATCFDFGKVHAMTWNGLSLDGIGQPGNPVPYIFHFQNSVEFLKMQQVATNVALEGGNSVVTTQIRFESVCRDCSLDTVFASGDNSTLYGISTVGTQDDNVEVTASEVAFYMDSPQRNNVQWQQHWHMASSTKVDITTADQGAGSRQEVRGHNIIDNLMSEGTANYPANATQMFASRYATGSGGFQWIRQEGVLGFQTYAGQNLMQHVYGNSLFDGYLMSSTGGILTPYLNARSTGNEVIGDKTFVGPNTSDPGSGCTFLRGSLNCSGDWGFFAGVPTVTGGHPWGLFSNWGVIPWTPPAGMSFAVMAGNDPGQTSLAISGQGVDATHVVAQGTDIYGTINWYKFQPGSPGHWQRMMYFNTLLNQLTLDNFNNPSAGIILSTGTAANTDGAFELTTGNTTTVASYTLSQNYSAYPPDCHFTPYFDIGSGNRMWPVLATSDSIHYTITFMAAIATTGGQHLKGGCTGRNN